MEPDFSTNHLYSVSRYKWLMLKVGFLRNPKLGSILNWYRVRFCFFFYLLVRHLPISLPSFSRFVCKFLQKMVLFHEILSYKFYVVCIILKKTNLIPFLEHGLVNGNESHEIVNNMRMMNTSWMFCSNLRIREDKK